MNKKPKSALNIPGTVLNSQNLQLLVSSGIPAFDDLLGDGLAAGTITLIEEDSHGTYARIMLKYFLAEGIVNKHSIFFATLEDQKEIITRLPALVETDDTNKQTISGKLKIAFRYSGLPTDDPKVKHQFGHYYDLSSTLSDDLLKNTNITCWQPDKTIKSEFFKNPAYGNLLQEIKSELKKGQFLLTDSPENRNILRIGIYGLGSPLWMAENEDDSKKDLNKFFLCLRAVLRSAFAVAVVTVPSHLYNQSTMGRCMNASDVSIRLQALGGTELEHNKYLADYHGYFHIDKLAAINTFASNHPGPAEYMFQLRRKKFNIKMLHLPPALDVSEDNKIPSFGCASNTKHLLEF